MREPRPIRFILEDTKTGRIWVYATEAMAIQAAKHLGLSDYTVERNA